MGLNNRFNNSQIVNATGDYGEGVIMKILGAHKRLFEHGADLEILGLGEIEVKTVQASQSVGVGISQSNIMQDRQDRLEIPQYYALNFYSMFNKKRVTQALQGCNILSLDEYIKRYLILETIFILPLPCILEFFSKSTNTLKSRGTRTTNIGPLGTYFDASQRKDKTSLKLTGFSPTKPDIILNIIGADMIERVKQVQENTGMILNGDECLK